jgi:phage tail protein X
VKLLGLVTLLSFLITLSILSTGVSSSVAETIFYNGTVIIRTYNQSVVYLPLQNITRLQASSHFILQNNKVFLANPDSVLSYQAKINGVIKISQPYNSSICIILPYQPVTRVQIPAVALWGYPPPPMLFPRPYLRNQHNGPFSDRHHPSLLSKHSTYP